MKSRSIPSLLFVVATVCGTLAPSQAAPQKRPQVLRSHCSDAVSDWFKGAYDYLKHGQVSAGKRPAIYATVSLVSTNKPSTVAGKAPDRTSVMVAQGEVTDGGFPVYVTLVGKLPMWINSGDPNLPFGSQTPSTLNVTLSETGAQTFNWQISGRNRLGQGPQPFALDAQTAQMTPDFLLYTGSVNFHGMKQITLTLLRGEADLTIPAAQHKPIGARYRVTPSFVVMSSNDGPGDNTLEVQTDVRFFQNGQIVGYLLHGGDAKAGDRLSSDPFEVVRLDDKPETYNLKVTGKIKDYDFASKKDTLWDRPHTLSIKGTAESKTGSLSIDPGFAPGDSDAYGNVIVRIEKIGDVY